jgi:hypothetical protein
VTLIVLTKLLKVADVNGKENPLILQLSMLMIWAVSRGRVEAVGQVINEEEGSPRPKWVLNDTRSQFKSSVKWGA